jgi:hypothetical protein
MADLYFLAPQEEIRLESCARESRAVSGQHFYLIRPKAGNNIILFKR